MTPPLRPQESMAIKDYDALAGLTIMVTGAARSLGAAFSDYFEDRGAAVWRTDIDASEGVHRLDVTSRLEWETSVKEALAEHGRIDGLVNNAGVFYGQRDFWDEADEELDHMINVNLKGTWVGTQIVSKRMAEGGHPGSIVNLSSTSGVMATKGYAGYGTTRWAVRGFTKLAAGDLAAHQIRVNSLHPHGVKGTGMILASAAAAGMTEEQVERIGTDSPMGRMGTTDDMGAIATFLLSSAASFITGREFVVDGGVTLSSNSS